MKTYTMDEIVRLNGEKGMNFFSPDTMRWWGTRLMPASVKCGKGGVFFVTSEYANFRREGRVYVVRKFYPKTARVGTVQRFNDANTAKRYAARCSVCPAAAKTQFNPENN